jgi:hypothetical protein
VGSTADLSEANGVVDGGFVGKESSTRQGNTAACMGGSHELLESTGRGNRPPGTGLWGGCCMRILEEFWYGNIEPTEYDTSSNKEYKKLVELIFRNEEKLRATMTDEQKELFEKYTDCVRENQVITDCLIFQNGFKLGARMMLEVMKE